MTASECLRYLCQEIHTTVAATVDGNGLPVTCAIDIMDTDQNGLYFLTAKGKGFYNRLKSRGYMALTGIKGKDTMSSVAVSVKGNIKELGSRLLPRLFKKNPYMEKIYPTAQSQKELTVFLLYEGDIEWFDLSKKPIERFSFSFGHAQKEKEGYFITASCNGCKACQAVCPQNCIDFTSTPAVIQKEHCLHCGNCLEICPQNAVVREGLR